MTAVPIRKVVDEAAKVLTGFGREPSWDHPRGMARAYYLHDASERQALQVQVDAAAASWSVGLFRYARLPESGETLETLHEAQRYLHGGFYDGEPDLQHKLNVAFQSVSRLHAVLWDAAAYDRGFRSSEAQREGFRAALPSCFRGALARLEPDSQGWLPLRAPAGFVFLKRVHPPRGTRFGVLPPSIRLHVSFETTPAPALEWNTGPWLIGRVEAETMAAAFFAEGRRSLEQNGAWTALDEPELRIDRVGAELVVVPSLSLVAWLHRSLRWQPVLAMLNDIPEPERLAVYAGTAEEVDQRMLLRRRIESDPTEMASYLALHKLYEAEGDLAHANLWAGLGYLRCKKLLGMAAAKLAAAAAADPHAPEIASALAELAAARK